MYALTCRGMMDPPSWGAAQQSSLWLRRDHCNHNHRVEVGGPACSEMTRVLMKGGGWMKNCCGAARVYPCQGTDQEAAPPEEKAGKISK